MGDIWENENNNNPDWYEEMLTDTEGTQHSSDKKEKTAIDVKPVKLSKKAAAIIICVGMLLMIIILATLANVISGGNVKNTTNNQSTEIGIEQSSNTGGYSGEESSDFSKNDTVFSESTGSGVEESNNVENTEKMEEVQETTENTEVVSNDEPSKNSSESSQEGFSVVAEPVLGDVYESTGMVSSKQVYKVGDTSYAYAINLVILRDNDNTSMVQYFCPRKTYDALSSGDTLSVQYQLDSSGCISIATISR